MGCQGPPISGRFPCPFPDSFFHGRTGYSVGRITYHSICSLKSAACPDWPSGPQGAIAKPMEAANIPETYAGAAPTTAHVLIADDQPHILDALQLLLKGCGFSTEAVTHPAHVLRALEAGPFDAVLLDLNYTRDTTAGEEGLELVSQIRSMDKLLPVVVMTAWGSVDQAVAAMRRGASDFVQKPWENRQLLQRLQNQLSQAQAKRWARNHSAVTKFGKRARFRTTCCPRNCPRWRTMKWPR